MSPVRRPDSIRARFGVVFGALLVLALLNVAALYWGARRRGAVFEDLDLAVRRHAMLTETRAALDDQHRRIEVLSTLVGVERAAVSPAERARVDAALVGIARRLEELPGADGGGAAGGIRERTGRLIGSWRRFYATQARDPARALSELVLTAEPLAHPLLSTDYPAAIRAQSRRVEQAREEFERADRESHRVVWGTLLVSGLLSVIVAFRLFRDLLAALQALKTAAERFGAGDLAHRVRPSRMEELEEVGASLNTMAERLRHARDELEVRNEELAQLAYRDPLTQLGNRALFRRSVEHALGVEGCRPEEVAVLFLDLDNFKAANDTLGHAAGDRLLTEVAVRILSVSHGSATVARLGGDEFAILLAPVRSPDDAALTAENVIVAVEAPLELDGRTVHVGASIGVAFGRDGGGADELLRDADVAMYRAKAAGKGRYEVFAPEMHTALLHRLELEAELRGVLERRELVLHYQPVVQLADGRVRGFEALVRWQHPARGLIPPTVFIPLAEESGMMMALGRWVLTEACREAQGWQADAMALDRVSIGVNVSGSQLESPRFVEDVRRALRGSGLDPHCLVLEITESAIMRDSEATLQRLRELKELGVRLAVDDFGTGYSSLAYLQRFPVDVLKIDKAFIDSVARGGNDAALARTILTLAEMLKLGTVAEGIEEADQLAQLRALGCELGQGYLFSRALEPASALAFLRGARAAQERARDPEPVS